MEEKCVYLRESICKASISRMSPAKFDYDGYCESEEHCNCPVLLAHTLRNGYGELLRAV
ncbi:MAG TPA: hypothetical protein VII64_11960 [Thermodesulfobacteriota bacterium]